MNLDDWKRTLAAAGVFVAWTLTSFLCHESSKMFLTASESMFLSENSLSVPSGLSYYRFFIAALVTAVQCLTCYLLVRTDSNMCQSIVTTVLIASHVLATLATNYSMAFIEASSTLAIKLMEPVTMTMAHHIVFKHAVPLQTIISIPLIIHGAFTFTAHKTSGIHSTAGIALAFASNIILAARNIAMKKMQHESSSQPSVVLKPSSQIAMIIVLQGLFVAGLYFLDVQAITPIQSSKLAAFALTSGVFHVAYSYISTCIVLKVMNVVSHSIANIFKRLLVVLLLSALGTRHLTTGNVLGLGIAVVGLLIHTHGKMNSGPEGDIKREGSRRRIFVSLLFLASLTMTAVSSSVTSVWSTRPLLPARRGPHSGGYLENYGLDGVRAALTDFSHISDAETDPVMQDFLSWRLVDHPEDTDKRSKSLTTSKEVIEEAQRILVNLMQDLIGEARHVIMVDVATYENKGDPAIAVGVVLLMRRMGKKIVYYCETYACEDKISLITAIKVNKRYKQNDLVILMNGGGNMVGYSQLDTIREKFINAFPERRMILLSQSIWLHGNYSAHLDLARSIYSNRSNLIMFIRDRQSLAIAKANFKGVRLILAPDMAFCIGMVPRQMLPLYDIVWLKRYDSEEAKYRLPVFPKNISVEVGNWHTWKSNKGRTDMDTAFIVASEGFQFLQRGRIVVTERLHGHILCVLMNIPHVLIDNPPYLKLSAFDKTWTQGLQNTILVNNGSMAWSAAQELLKRYEKSLPSIGPRDKFAVT